MKKTFVIILSLLICLSFSVFETVRLSYPDYFPKPAYNFEKNPLTESKIELGRALFYDPILSKDNSISCSSCHTSHNAFAHTDHDLSHGIGDSIGNRNAPALMNLAWQNSFMWDGAINHLDVQALAPIDHPKEMGEKLSNVIQKLKKSPIYPNLFQDAYGDSSISSERLLKALSQFQLTLVSSNSIYDKVKREEITFTKQQENGYALFRKNCNSCHTEPLFSNYRFANNGLSIDSTLMDYGKGSVTKLSKDSLTFKIPTLRNLSYSYPYMHDGRFEKLYEVINHYSGAKFESKTLDARIKKPIKLTDNEKVDLITFLLTLNDKEFVSNPKFKFPRKILLPTKGSAKK